MELEAVMQFITCSVSLNWWLCSVDYGVGVVGCKDNRMTAG